jgi:hypothetical protein
VAAATIVAIERGMCGRRYILAGHTMSYLDAWRLFAQVSGGRRPWGCPGPVQLWIAGRVGDLWTRLTGTEFDINSGSLALARLPKHYSSERAIRELNYQMRPVVESTEDAWKWFVEYGYANPV